MEEIFLPKIDSDGNEDSHSIRISFIPPKSRSKESVMIEFRAVGEDESDYRISIMSAKCGDKNLEYEKNIFQVPQNIIFSNKRLEVELKLNENLGTSAFRLLHILPASSRSADKILPSR